MSTYFSKEFSNKVRKSIVDDNGKRYTTLAFICPGCVEFGGSGLVMLPVNTSVHKPAWVWDGNLFRPTLNPSIMTSRGTDQQCHSFLKAGVFQYLADSKHSLAGQFVDMVDLPYWIVHE